MHINFNNNKPYYIFERKTQNIAFLFIALGILGVALGFVLGETAKTFANLLMMSYYFLAVCLAGTVFIALQYITRSGWSVAILRIAHAFSKTTLVAAPILVIVVLSGLFLHQLYHHWADPSLLDPMSENYDKIIAGKSAYLNVPFFSIRVLFLLAIYIFFGILITKTSLREDDEGGIKNYKRNIKLSAGFIVIFAFTYPLFSFDVIMSIEAHWYSTMFGWYNFAGLWVSGLATMAIVINFLKRRGYLEWVNSSHLHDLGKFIFGFSIFWTYLWFCQFLLIYYANLPEETVYFYKRLNGPYRPLFFINVLVCFLAPFLLLMSRGAKRKFNYLKWVSVVILVGHYIDYYLMFMPGIVENTPTFSYIEISSILLFVGIFILTMLKYLSSKVLIPTNHPLLEESLNHHQ